MIANVYKTRYMGNMTHSILLAREGLMGKVWRIGFGCNDLISKLGDCIRICGEKFECRCQIKLGKLVGSWEK